MKALTVRQPWAWAIAEGHKTVENRSRPTKHRGPLAIHAAVTFDHRGLHDAAMRATAGDFRLDQMRRACGHSTPETRTRGRWWGDPGRVIAIVDVVGCHRADDQCCQPWGTPDAWHWELANARELDQPIPATGRLGLWDIDLPPDPEDIP